MAFLFTALSKFNTRALSCLAIIKRLRNSSEALCQDQLIFGIWTPRLHHRHYDHDVDDCSRALPRTISQHLALIPKSEVRRTCLSCKPALHVHIALVRTQIFSLDLLKDGGAWTESTGVNCQKDFVNYYDHLGCEPCLTITMLNG